MKRIGALLSSRWVIMAISTLSALLLWYYAYMNNNPYETQEYKLNFVMRSVSGLAAKDKFLMNEDVLEAQKITVRLRAARTTHAQLAQDVKDGAVYAYIDFSMSHLLYAGTGNVTAEVNLFFPARYDDENFLVERVTKSPDYVTAQFDEIQEKTLTVKARLTGELSDDPAYSAGAFTVTPDKVTLRAPSAELNKITALEIPVDPPKVDIKTAGAPNEYTVNGVIRALDRNGEVVKNENITFVGVSTVQVAYNVVKVKEIPIVMPEITGVPAEGWALNPTNPVEDFSPRSVEIKGTKEDVDKVANIKINPVSADGRTGADPTVTDNLRRYLSEVNNKLEFVNPGVGDITVSMRIEKLVEKTYYFAVNHVTLLGLEDIGETDIRVNEMYPSAIKMLTVRAVESFFETFDDVYDIVTATADLALGAATEPGEYDIHVTFTAAEGYVIVSSPERLRVTITAPPVIEEPTMPEPTDEPAGGETPLETETPPDGDGEGNEGENGGGGGVGGGGDDGEGGIMIPAHPTETPEPVATDAPEPTEAVGEEPTLDEGDGE